MKPSLRRALGIAGAIALGLVLAEGMLRVLAVPFPVIDAVLLPDGRLLPDNRLGTALNPAFPGHDARGFRNPSESPRPTLSSSVIRRRTAWAWT